MLQDKIYGIVLPTDLSLIDDNFKEVIIPANQVYNNLTSSYLNHLALRRIKAYTNNSNFHAQIENIYKFKCREKYTMKTCRGYTVNASPLQTLTTDAGRVCLKDIEPGTRVAVRSKADPLFGFQFDTVKTIKQKIALEYYTCIALDLSENSRYFVNNILLDAANTTR